MIITTIITHSGVPFSTKEGIRVKGMRNSYGSPIRRNVRAKNDAEGVRLLRKVIYFYLWFVVNEVWNSQFNKLSAINLQAGAIALCVTNVSEIGCWWESSNPVYGVSKNPYDILRTPGGSSGGEAALQTAAGIPISLGMALIQI